jgi:hypothetical protein
MKTNKDQHAHPFQDLTHAANLEGLFHSHQNLVEISWCSMDDAHYTMQFPIGKRRWMLKLKMGYVILGVEFNPKIPHV